MKVRKKTMININVNEVFRAYKEDPYTIVFLHVGGHKSIVKFNNEEERQKGIDWFIQECHNQHLSMGVYDSYEQAIEFR